MTMQFGTFPPPSVISCKTMFAKLEKILGF